MATYEINLDDFCEDIFFEMERLSEGVNGHEFAIEAESIFIAAELASKKLIPFLRDQMKEI